jgi:hypothetical protein
MINDMVTWLNRHGYPADAHNPESVIWAIDRHYPGGFNRFVSECPHRRSRR